MGPKLVFRILRPVPTGRCPRLRRRRTRGRHSRPGRGTHRFGDGDPLGAAGPEHRGARPRRGPARRSRRSVGELAASQRRAVPARALPAAGGAGADGAAPPGGLHGDGSRWRHPVQSRPKHRRAAYPTARARTWTSSRFETMTTCRRPLIEYAYAAAARKTPGVEVRYGCPAAGLVTGNEVIPGVPHITGVRTESGETIDASVVVDAAGRRSPLSGMIEAAGGRQPPEHAFEAGFVYNTQYYRGASLPEPRDDLLCAIGSISVLTIPGDHGWWSVTLYHSPKDKLMRNVRDPKIFERVVRSLPNHAHWADGAAAGRQLLHGQHGQHDARVRRGRRSVRHRGGTRRRCMGFHQPFDRPGHHPRPDARGGHRPGNRGAHGGPAPARRRVGAPDRRAGRQVARLDGRLRPDPRSRGRGPFAGAPGSLRSFGPVGRRASGVRLGVALRPGSAAMVLRGASAVSACPTR